MKVLLVLFVALAVAFADKCADKCANCPKLERSECLAGIDKDPECHCCEVCSRLEGQTCDLKDEQSKHGSCGDGLDCKKTPAGNVCHCHWEGIICGSDGVTYNNLCQLLATAVREERKLEAKFNGPCDKGAQITTKPGYLKNATHNNIVLTCEAIGFPTPTITWNVTNANKKTFALPGDDDHIVVAERGGPGKYHVTGWMQIENLLKKHEGDYECIAFNEHRTDKAKARVKVIV